MAAPQFTLEQSDKETFKKRREDAEFVLRIAEGLNPRQRALVKLVYEYDVPVSLVATATDTSPSKLYSSLNVVLKRLRKPEVRFLWRKQKMLPPDVRNVVIRNMFQGKNAQEISDEYGYPVNWIRDVLRSNREYALMMLEQEAAGQAAAGK